MLQLHKRPCLYDRINLIQARFERNDSAETTMSVMPVMLEAVESTFHRSGSLTDSLVSPYSSCPVPRKCRHVAPAATQQRWTWRRKVGASACTVRHSSMVRHRVLIPGYGWHVVTWWHWFYPFTAWHVWRYVSTASLMCIWSPMSGIPSGNRMWQLELLCNHWNPMGFRRADEIRGISPKKLPCLIAEGWMVKRDPPWG